MIRKTSALENVKDANDLREVILKDLFDKDAPSNAALAYIKNEVGEL